MLTTYTHDDIQLTDPSRTGGLDIPDESPALIASGRNVYTNRVGYSVNHLIRNLVQPFCADGTVREVGRRLARSLQRSDPHSSLQPEVRIGAALDAKLPTEGRIWAERIESLRNSLLYSDEKVRIPTLGGSKKTSVPRPSSPDELTRSVGEMCNASSGPTWGRGLFNAAAAAKPDNCLELGTCLGISAAYQAAALREIGNGKLITLEGSPDLATVARRNLAGLGLGNVEVRIGSFAETLQPTLDDLSSVDFAFIDGHHDEQATLRYFKTILPHTANGAVLIFDDIRWSRGMRRAWRRIAAHPSTQSTLDLRRWGICFVSPGESG